MRTFAKFAITAAAFIGALAFFAPAQAKAEGTCSGPCAEALVKCGNGREIFTTAGGTRFADCGDGATRSFTHKQKVVNAYVAPRKAQMAPTKTTRNKPIREVTPVALTGSFGNIPTNVRCGNDFNAGDITVDFDRCPNGGFATFAPIDQKTLKAALKRGLAVVQYSHEVAGCYYFKDAVETSPMHYRVKSARGVLISNGGYSKSETAIAIGFGPKCNKTKYGTKYMLRVNSVQEALAIAGK